MKELKEFIQKYLNELYEKNKDLPWKRILIIAGIVFVVIAFLRVLLQVIFTFPEKT